MHNLSYLLRSYPKNEGLSCLKGACGYVNTEIYIKSAWGHFLTIFLRKKVLKYSTLILLRCGSSGPQLSFSWKWGMGKLKNQPDGWKGLLKWGIHIVTACKKLANMKNNTPSPSIYHICIWPNIIYVYDQFIILNYHSIH